MRKTTIGMAGGLLLVYLVCTFSLADEPQQPRPAAPSKKTPVKQADVKQADVKQVAGKNQDAAPGKQPAKAQAPPGYEDAPVARDPAAARVLAAPLRRIDPRIMEEWAEDADAETLAVGFEKLLAAKVDANVVTLEKRLVAQFTPLLTAELSFINRACDMSLEQRQQLKAAEDRCLRGATRKYAMAQRGLVRRVGRQQLVPDPNDVLHQALAKALQDTLRPEQLTRYAQEMAARRAFRRRVALENIVAIIDERLVLSTEQRRQLSESLDKNWQPSWVQSIEMLMNNTTNLPNIPDEFVVPILDETQKPVWQTTPKQSYAMFGGFGIGQVGAVDDFLLIELEDIEFANPFDLEPAN